MLYIAFDNLLYEILNILNILNTWLADFCKYILKLIEIIIPVEL